MCTPLATLLLACSPAQGPPAQEPPAQEPAVLRVDPRLLAQAAEVWSVIAHPDNPLWPGWDASDTPLLFYFPGVQDVLVDHPDPPPGFRPVAAPPGLPFGTILARDGETRFDLDGQNTSKEVNGVPTLVVADTLSNLRQQLSTLIASGHPTLTFETLAADPYDQLGTIVHEAFHVFQGRWGADKLVSETLLLQYPLLDVQNEVGIALEAAALAEALEAEDEEALWGAALRWLAVRTDRRSRLPAAAVAYEDGTEFNEGLAKYAEWRLSEVLEGREPGAAMAWVRDFRGYGDLSSVRARLVSALRRFLTGEQLVNNDPYGTAPVRYRLYYSGMAVAALLDRLLPEWKERMAEPGATLTGLAREALMPLPEDLQRALGEARSAEGLADLVAAKTRLREEGLAAARALLDSILDGPGTLLTLDYAAQGAPPVGFSFTPFGITPIDAGRTIYGMVPISAQLADGGRLRQTVAAPFLQDAGAQQLRFRLPGELTRAALLEALGRASLPEGPLDDLHLVLEGVELDLPRARLRLGERELVVEALAR